MANLTIQNKLVTSNPGNIIADAVNIAYSTKTEGSGALAYEAMDKSIKDKIDEVAALAASGGNLEEVKTAIEAEITAIKARLDAISLTADKVSYSYTSGDLTIVSTVKAQLDSLQASINTLGNIQEAATNAAASASAAAASEAAVSAVKDDVTEIKNIAKDLSTSFDADATMVICPENTYSASTANDNTLYFCY